MPDRYVVETTRNKIHTNHSYENKDGETVGVATGTYESIRLVDSQGIWPHAEFQDIRFAQMCADALNKSEEGK